MRLMLEREDTFENQDEKYLESIRNLIDGKDFTFSRR